MNTSGKYCAIESYTNTIIRCRYIISITTIALCFIIGFGKSKIGFSSDYHYYFGHTTPQIQALEELDSTYANSDSIYFFITPKDNQTVFKPEIIAAIEDLTKRAWLMSTVGFALAVIMLLLPAIICLIDQLKLPHR